MIMRLIIAIFVALTTTICGHYYVYNRLIEPLIGKENSFGIIIFSLFWALTFFGFLLIRILPQLLRKFVEIIMFSWMGTAFILFVICLFTFPLQIAFNYFGWVQKNLSIGILAFGIIVIIYSIFQALRKPAIIHTTIPIPNSLPIETEEITAVVISDIHVSGLIGRKKMLSLVERVNKLHPDFIFITGDLMDGSVKQLKNEIEPLKDLKAKEGVIYITGNHEYYSGPIAWKNHFEEVFNWQILSNSSKTFHIKGVTLNILGIEDKHWLSYEKIPRKMDQRLQVAVEHLRHNNSMKKNFHGCLNILLAHQPKDAKYLKSYPWINLQISGHTHGGQIWPLHYVVLKDQKYSTGLYKITDNQSIYVNQGTGFWGPPMRLGTRSEITFMKFKRGY